MDWRGGEVGGMREVGEAEAKCPLVRRTWYVAKVTLSPVCIVRRSRFGPSSPVDELSGHAWQTAARTYVEVMQAWGKGGENRV